MVGKINLINMRDCCKVIINMLEKIPSHKVDLIRDLQWNYNDACYKAPEQTLQWSRTQATLVKHILLPTEDWEFEILSIFSTLPIDDIRRYASGKVPK